MVLVADEDGVSGIEGEFVFAGKSAASGNADAKELAKVIDFELLDGAGENLLVNLGAETDAVGDGGGSVG